MATDLKNRLRPFHPTSGAEAVSLAESDVVFLETEAFPRLAVGLHCGHGSSQHELQQMQE